MVWFYFVLNDAISLYWPFALLFVSLPTVFLMRGKRRGLVVSTEDCCSKGRGIKSRSFSFFYSFKPREKKRKTTNVSRKEETRQKKRERRDEEEKPASVSGMDI